jgi:HAD superfamily hydrolase (TIGR01509 family)
LKAIMKDDVIAGFEAVMFDCDGVLVDSEFLAAKAHGDELRHLGLAADDRDLAFRYVGIASKAMVPMLAQQFGTALPEDYLVRVRARMTALCEPGLPPIEGVRALVESLTRPACIVSNSGPAWIRRALEATGLLERFDGRIFSAEMVDKGKPAPDVFLLAANTLGVSPVRCLVIEDSCTGVSAAKAAGMTVFGFHGGRHCGADAAANLRAAGATMCFPTMAEIQAALSAV